MLQLRKVVGNRRLAGNNIDRLAGDLQVSGFRLLLLFVAVAGLQVARLAGGDPVQARQQMVAEEEEKGYIG